MRLALWQGASPAGDAEAAFAEIARALAAAKGAGADMALMPELFLPGYGVEPMRADPGWPARLSRLAAEAGTGLCIGLAEEEGGALVNVARAFGPDGALLARYVKTQLFGAREKRLFAPGSGPVAFDFAGTRIALLICYDVEFPELVRASARLGAELILVPTANPEPFDTVQRFTVPAQAAMNGLAVAYANFCGTEGGLTYNGLSLIAAPDGEPLASAGRRPAFLVVDLPSRSDPTLRALSTQLEDLRE